MRWFAYQRSPGGKPVPVAFDEHPDKEWDSCVNVFWHTIKPIPDEMKDASLADLVAWDKDGMVSREIEMDYAKPDADPLSWFV